MYTILNYSFLFYIIVAYRCFVYSHDICAPVAFDAPVPVASVAPGTCDTAAVSAVPGSSLAATAREREGEREGERKNKLLVAYADRDRNKVCGGI